MERAAAVSSHFLSKHAVRWLLRTAARALLQMFLSRSCGLWILCGVEWCTEYGTLVFGESDTGLFHEWCAQNGDKTITSR